MTEKKIVAPFGEWKSTIAPIEMATSGILIQDPSYARNGSLFWLEGRPTDSGRVVLVERTVDGRVRDWTPAPFNVRTRVHEYGGAAYWTSEATHGRRASSSITDSESLSSSALAADEGNTIVWFVDFNTCCIHMQTGPESIPIALTKETDKLHRYAEGAVHPEHSWIISIRERHAGPCSTSADEITNELVVLSTSTEAANEPHIIAGGAATEGAPAPSDFVASPCFSPNGRQLAWMAWNIPNMPWDNTCIYVADFNAESGMIEGEPRLVAGGDTSNECACSPVWSVTGDLYFMTDKSGFWNLHKMTQGSDHIASVWTVEKDCAGPMWSLGSRSYLILPNGDALVVALLGKNGQLAYVSASSSSSSSSAQYLDLDANEIGFPMAISHTGDKFAFVAFTATTPQALMEGQLTSTSTGIGTNKYVATSNIVRSSSDTATTADPGSISLGIPITYTSSDGVTTHAFFYTPTNAAYCGPSDQLPPVIVLSHGGPTSYVGSGYKEKIQFWTTRGFCICDVNYRGSAGYGRAYRQALNTRWGEVDVEDCVSAVRYLVDRSLVDPNRLIIMGGSAGGYTTLASLAFRPGVFAAGISDYGIGDLVGLAECTHKFESRYLDSMVAPYPEGIDIYKARSPQEHSDKITTPLLLLQGEDDRVVPPSQALSMANALNEREVPHALVLFKGEGHGFRMAKNIEASYRHKLSFLGQVLGLDPADVGEEHIEIKHHCPRA